MTDESGLIVPPAAVTFITGTHRRLTASFGGGDQHTDAIDARRLPGDVTAAPVGNVQDKGDGDCGDTVGFQLDTAITVPAEIRELAAAA